MGKKNRKKKSQEKRKVGKKWEVVKLDEGKDCEYVLGVGGLYPTLHETYSGTKRTLLPLPVFTASSACFPEQKLTHPKPAQRERDLAIQRMRAERKRFLLQHDLSEVVHAEPELQQSTTLGRGQQQLAEERFRELCLTEYERKSYEEMKLMSPEQYMLASGHRVERFDRYSNIVRMMIQEEEEAEYIADATKELLWSTTLGRGPQGELQWQSECPEPMCAHMTQPVFEDIIQGQMKQLEELEIYGQNEEGKSFSFVRTKMESKGWSGAKWFGSEVTGPLGRYRQGIKAPIAAQTEYGFEYSSENHPGFGYLNGWEVTGLVPEEIADDIAAQNLENPFETASQALDMLAPFKELETKGTKMVQMTFKEVDRMDRRRDEILNACQMRKLSSGSAANIQEYLGMAVVEPFQYFRAGSLTTKEFVFVANDYIVRGGPLIRDRMASFLRPEQTQWGVEKPPDSGDRPRSEIIRKLKRRLATRETVWTRLLEEVQQAWPPTGRYQDLAVAYDAVISAGEAILTAYWPEGGDQQEEKAALQKEMQRINFQFADLLAKALDEDEDLKQRLQPTTLGRGRSCKREKARLQPQPTTLGRGPQLQEVQAEEESPFANYQQAPPEVISEWSRTITDKYNAFRGYRPQNQPQPQRTTLGRGQPQPTTLGRGQPQPTTLGRGQPQPTTLGRGQPQPTTLGRGQPQPTTLGRGQPQPTTLGRGQPQPTTLGRGQPQQHKSNSEGERIDFSVFNLKDFESKSWLEIIEEEERHKRGEERKK
ncbi:hypothetical protein niasHT_005485 [Heterodera trifolii]|uniref:Uncharacterized protein n=1 Tax=Heterodera trifolii TaxID=157864 RepID=A0ABD2M5G5_9BILA